MNANAHPDWGWAPKVRCNDLNSAACRTECAQQAKHPSAKAIAEQDERPSPIESFQLQAWARAYLVGCGLLDFHAAVDGLQSAAEKRGLIDLIGQDAVQQIIAWEFEVAHV